uniref:Uncharacterized protein n=1 Tax=Anopheles darlingi TaxID=43151 RepID=A0A2M4DHS4_ANODA
MFGLLACFSAICASLQLARHDFFPLFVTGRNLMFKIQCTPAIITGSSVVLRPCALFVLVFIAIHSFR